MPLPNRNSIKTRIVFLFASRPVLSAKEIHMQLSEGGGAPCSIQAVYQELRSLLEEEIVRKIGKSYALDASWAIQLQSFSRSMVRSSFSDTAGLSLFTGRKKQSWKFSSLLDLNDFWAHMDLYLSVTSSKTILAWNPHLWFYLIHLDTELKFLKSLRMSGGRFCVIVGSDCYLNKRVVPYYKEHGVTYSYAPGPFKGQMDTYINVIGDHVVTAKMAASTARHLDELFRKTRKIDELAVEGLIGLFASEGKSTLTLEHNAEKARRLRRKFERFFGEKFTK